MDIKKELNELGKNYSEQSAELEARIRGIKKDYLKRLLGVFGFQGRYVKITEGPERYTYIHVLQAEEDPNMFCIALWGSILKVDKSSSRYSISSCDRYSFSPDNGKLYTGDNVEIITEGEFITVKNNIINNSLN